MFQSSEWSADCPADGALHEQTDLPEDERRRARDRTRPVAFRTTGASSTSRPPPFPLPTNFRSLATEDGSGVNATFSFQDREDALQVQHSHLYPNSHDVSSSRASGAEPHSAHSQFPAEFALRTPEPGQIQQLPTSADAVPPHPTHQCEPPRLTGTDTSGAHLALVSGYASPSVSTSMNMGADAASASASAAAAAAANSTVRRQRTSWGHNFMSSPNDANSRIRRPRMSWGHEFVSPPRPQSADDLQASAESEGGTGMGATTSPCASAGGGPTIGLDDSRPSSPTSPSNHMGRSVSSSLTPQMCFSSLFEPAASPQRAWEARRTTEDDERDGHESSAAAEQTSPPCGCSETFEFATPEAPLSTLGAGTDPGLRRRRHSRRSIDAADGGQPSHKDGLGIPRIRSEPAGSDASGVVETPKAQIVTRAAKKPRLAQPPLQGVAKQRVSTSAILDGYFVPSPDTMEVTTQTTEAIFRQLEDETSEVSMRLIAEQERAAHDELSEPDGTSLFHNSMQMVG